MHRVVIALALACSTAAAEPRHAIYGELFGKGGLWGAGYDFQLTPRFAVGTVASYYVLAGDHYLTVAPYVAAYPLLRGRHRWFLQAGPQIVRRATPSPVPEWDGMSTTAVGGELSSGYEFRSRVLVRAYGMASVGDRLAPWFGVSFGWSL